MAKMEGHFCSLPKLKFVLSITGVKLKKNKIFNFKARAVGIDHPIIDHSIIVQATQGYIVTGELKKTKLTKSWCAFNGHCAWTGNSNIIDKLLLSLKKISLLLT